MFVQVKAILRYMDSYMAKHPDEIRLGLMVESSRYKYGKVICDLDVIILALEKKMHIMRAFLRRNKSVVVMIQSAILK